jgi:hypothetical protein
MTTTAACSGSATTDGLSPTTEDTSNSALTAQQPSSTGVALVEATDLTDVIATLMPAGRVDLQPTEDRVIKGARTLTAPPSTLELSNDAVARWILPAGNNTWIAVLDDGTALEVDGSDVPIRTQTVERSPPNYWHTNQQQRAPRIVRPRSRIVLRPDPCRAHRHRRLAPLLTIETNRSLSTRCAR